MIIPALNEEASLPLVLAAIPPGIAEAVIVVDNASTDGTALVARAGGAVVVREERRGYGAACLRGISPGRIFFSRADRRSARPARRAAWVKDLGTGGKSGAEPLRAFDDRQWRAAELVELARVTPAAG